MGGEVGGVGLYYDAGEGDGGAEHGGKFRLLKRDYAANAEHKAGEGGEEFFCLFGGASEAVEHACEFFAEREEGADEVAVGRSAMDHEGQMVANGPLCLLGEGGDLLFSS